MGKLQDFLLNEFRDEPVQTDVEIKGFPYPFVIKSIKQDQNKAIEASCKKITFNKKTHEKEVETDQSLYATRLIAACCVEPNFKDAELQNKFGVMGEESLIEKILSAGQYADLLRAVSEVNDFGTDINDLIEEAKNS